MLFLLLLLTAAGGALLRLRGQRDALLRELSRTPPAAPTPPPSHDWLAAICAHAAEPIIVTDGWLRLLHANPAAERLFGAAVPGESAIQRLRHHRLEALLRIAVEQGQAEPWLFEHGEQQFLVTTHGWGPPERRGAIMTLREITELNRLSRARRDMASNLSHELRTPLSSVKLIAETLLGGALKEEALARRLVNRIAVENEAMIRLVEDLTTLSSIEQGHIPLRLEPVNLRELVDWRIERLAPQQVQKGVHFALDAPRDVTVDLDRERFGQVLTNLFDNALRFSPEGGTVHVALHQDASGTTLTVRDEGPGIPSTTLPRVFERFYKGDTVRARSTGTGLGLAIARHLVEAHGGTITVENHPTQGALFTVHIPPA